MIFTPYQYQQAWFLTFFKGHVLHLKMPGLIQRNVCCCSNEYWQAYFLVNSEKVFVREKGCLPKPSINILYQINGKKEALGNKKSCCSSKCSKRRSRSERFAVYCLNQQSEKGLLQHYCFWAMKICLETFKSISTNCGSINVYL